jgi:hypothetical protein
VAVGAQEGQIIDLWQSAVTNGFDVVDVFPRVGAVLSLASPFGSGDDFISDGLPGSDDEFGYLLLVAPVVEPMNPVILEDVGDLERSPVSLRVQILYVFDGFVEPVFETDRVVPLGHCRLPF